MNIEQIQKELEKEITLNDFSNYKKLRNVLNRIYRHLNKDKVKLWNDKYNKKKSIIKNTSYNDKDIKNTSYENDDLIKNTSYENDLNIF